MEEKRIKRGLGSLIGSFDDDIIVGKHGVEIATNRGVEEINLSLIDINRNQPRKNFDATALKELADSIRVHGVIQPIIVIKQNERYVIVAGERRFRASKMVGLKTIPAVVKNYSPKEVKEIALIENIQREDLNPIEVARGMNELLKIYGWTQDILAERLGKSRPAITNFIRLLSLTPEVLKMVEEGKLSAGHARSLVVISDPTIQLRMAKVAVDKKITVRDLEREVAKMQEKPAAKKGKMYSIEMKEVVRVLEKKLSTKVVIAGDDNKGKICIEYFTRDDLERIVLQLNK